MNSLTIISLISFAPAIFLLYVILGEYEGYFKDNKALFMVILGLGIGMIIGFFSVLFELSDFLWVVLLVFLIELIKMVILLQKPFRLNHDTTFYGMGLGIGIGAMFVFTNIYLSGVTAISIESVSFVLLFSINYTFINSATGAVMGYGSYQGEFWKYLFRAFIIHGIHGFLMSLVWGIFTTSSFSITAMYALLIIGVVYNVFLMFYVYNVIFDKTIPKEMKKVKKKASDT